MATPQKKRKKWKKWKKTKKMERYSLSLIIPQMLFMFIILLSYCPTGGNTGERCRALYEVQFV